MKHWHRSAVVLTTTLLATALWASTVAAQEVKLTPNRASASFVLNGQSITIGRNQDTAATLTGDFARTSRACPPDCIQPMVAAAGVVTIAELETIAFVEQIVVNAQGLLIDSRLPASFAQGTIPGAVNVPFAALAEDNPYLSEILRALGARNQGGGDLTFADAMDLAVFADGPWSGDARRAIESLLAAGYPASKIRYYRGGMQDWLSLGLTVSHPQNQG